MLIYFTFLVFYSITLTVVIDFRIIRFLHYHRKNSLINGYGEIGLWFIH